jgi:RecA/RadA recombinase
MTVLSPADLLGRTAELAGFAGLLDGPGGGAMVVLGEAGSGKTALLDTATAEQRNGGETNARRRQGQRLVDPRYP